MSELARTATGFTVTATAGAIILEIETLQGGRVAVAFVPGLARALASKLLQACGLALKDLLSLREMGERHEDGSARAVVGSGGHDEAPVPGGSLGERPP